MPDLPLIQLDEPVTVPQVAARTYPLMWLRSLHVSTIPSDTVTGGGSIEMTIAPMAADGTGDILSDSPQVISTDRLWQAINEVPQVAQAVAANLAAAVPLKAWLASLPPENNP